VSKKVVCLAVVTLAVPLGAFANSVDAAARGVISSNSRGLSLTRSALIAYGSTVATTQINTGASLFDGSAKLSSGKANLNVAVPEPDSLALLGTGLLGTGLVGLTGIRRRRRSLT
jgi:hypothetical protein